MKVLIKNMVCRHCIEAVRRIVESTGGLTATEVGLGFAELDGEPAPEQLASFASRLSDEGFELIQSRDSALVENIKKNLIERVWNPQRFETVNVSDQLSDALSTSYPVLSRLFSEVEGRTIENYLKTLRVERVKELIKYENMTLAAIADAAGYSSEAHLSRSFKQVTGLTPGQFRALGHRTPLPEV